MDVPNVMRNCQKWTLHWGRERERERRGVKVVKINCMRSWAVCGVMNRK